MSLGVIRDWYPGRPPWKGPWRCMVEEDGSPFWLRTAEYANGCVVHFKVQIPGRPA